MKEGNNSGRHLCFNSMRWYGARFTEKATAQWRTAKILAHEGAIVVRAVIISCGERLCSGSRLVMVQSRGLGNEIVVSADDRYPSFLFSGTSS